MGFNARTHPVTVNWTAYPIATTQITADTTWAIYKAPFACQVIDAGFVQVEDEIAKSATNHLIAYILNGGAAGTGPSVFRSGEGRVKVIHASVISVCISLYGEAT